MIILSLQLYTSDERHARITFVWDQSTCQESVESDKNAYPQLNSNPQPCDLKSSALQTKLTRLDESCTI